MQEVPMRYLTPILLKGLVLSCSLFALVAPAAELHIDVVGSGGEPVWARLEVRSPDGQMYQPLFALRDRTARNRPGGGPWYRGSFAAQGKTVVEVPAGSYTVVAERGPEFGRLEETVTVSEEQPAELRVRLEPWIRMNERGWWSADFHVHRPSEDAAKLVLAEDLNLGVVFTMWNKQDLWQDKEFPTQQEIAADPNHLITVLNAEDERGGGAWMFHGLRHKLDLAADGRWFPLGLKFIQDAKAQRYYPRGFPWFDSEKPFWWEVPVVMALSPPDSFGVIHNHFNQYGINDSEAWGRPRGSEKYPGPEGFVEASLDLYYRYLNLGFRIPPSAGSASGVLPNPVGYNRIYVQMDRPFSVQSWYDAYRDNNSFVTNGPMVSLYVDGGIPGDEVKVAKGTKVRIRARAWAPRSIGSPKSMEVVAHGRVIRSSESSDPENPELNLDFKIHADESQWIAVRANSHNGAVAHTTPVYLLVDGKNFRDKGQVPKLVEKRLKLLNFISERLQGSKLTDTYGRGEVEALTEEIAQAKARYEALISDHE